MDIFARARWTLCGALSVLLASTGLAAVCSVPSGPYPTIATAVSDPSCTEIVLAAETFRESLTIDRDLLLRGTSSAATRIEGQLTAEGGSTEVTLEDLTVDAGAPGMGGTYPEALQVEGGAELVGRDIVVLNAADDPFLVFTDGFESGDTSAWSFTVE